MKCIHCGFENKTTNKFCESCGKPLSSQEKSFVKDFTPVKVINRAFIPLGNLLAGILIGIIVSMIVFWPLFIILQILFSQGFWAFFVFLLIPIFFAYNAFQYGKKRAETMKYKVYSNWVEIYSPDKEEETTAINLNGKSKAMVETGPIQALKKAGNIIIKTPEVVGVEKRAVTASIKFEDVLNPEDYLPFIGEIIDKLEEDDPSPLEKLSSRATTDTLLVVRPKVVLFRVLIKSLPGALFFSIWLTGVFGTITTFIILGGRPGAGWSYLAWLGSCFLIFMILLVRYYINQTKRTEYIINQTTIDHYENIKTGKVKTYTLKPSTMVYSRLGVLNLLRDIGTVHLYRKEKAKYADDYKEYKLKLRDIEDAEEVCQVIQNQIKSL